MASPGFAVAVFREEGQWQAEALPPAVLGDLGILLSALRSQPPEGGPFIVANIEDEFFLIARMDGARTSLLLSDLTAASDFPLAAQVLDRLGEDPPDDDELDEVWPVGDLEMFDDMGLSESDMEQLLEDDDAYVDELLDEIMQRLDLQEQYAQAIQRVR
jgi:putative tRNA adenosine deaminase-associated protein